MTTQKVIEAWNDAQACDGPCVRSERWYVRKHRWIGRRAKAHGVDMDLACTVYALMSWNNAVANNDRVFELWLRTGIVGMFGACERKVRQAESGDLVGALTFKNGRKITTFAENLRHPWAFRGATIDRHAGDIVTGDRRTTKNTLARVRGTGYDLLESFYVEAARQLGVKPHEVQARTWCHRVYCEGMVD